MKKILIPNQTDIRNILENELRKKQKLISVQEIRTFIKQEVMRQSKDIYRKMDKLRKKIQELELNKNLKYTKLKLPGKNEI